MYDKSILAKSTGASLGVVAIVGLLFMSTGTAFAMPVAGIGGFTIQAEEIRGEGMVLYPGTSDAENSTDASASGADEYPLGVVELDSTEIDGMRLQKVFDLQNVTTGVMSGKARIVIISGGQVESETLIMKTPQLAAEQADFSGLEIDESPVTDANDIPNWLVLRTDQEPDAPITGQPGQVLDESANSLKKNYTGGSAQYGLVMEGAFIRSTYLATDSITMPDMQLEVQYDPDNDGDYEWASN